MNSTLKNYNTPSATVITLAEEDILTMSSGCDGEVHTCSLCR